MNRFAFFFPEKGVSSENKCKSEGGVSRKRCSENMQQICRRTLMPKCDFNKVAKQLY